MQLVFKNCAPLNIKLDDTALAADWYQLVKQNYEKNPNAIFRDQPKYTLAYLKTLADDANKKLGWDWPIDNNLDLFTTVRLHKDIENYLSRGFENIPEEFDNLLHEIHFCLHAVESGSKRSTWLQIEWFNDEGFHIAPDQYPAKINLDFGDIRLQNPYVGHHPLFVFQQRDSINIASTCQFHDLARPGFCVVIEQENETFSWQRYLHWFETHAADWIEEKGLNNLIKYTGHPVIGKITNLKDLENCLSMHHLEFEKIVFD